MNEKKNKDEIIEQYEKKQKRDKIQKIILILAILVLLGFGVLSNRLGEIGYQDVSMPLEEDNIKLIKVPRKCWKKRENLIFYTKSGIIYVDYKI